MLNLHEEAKKNFNIKAEEYVNFFKPYNPSLRKEHKSDHYVTAHITEKDIISPIKFHYLINEIGENVSLVTYDKESQYIIDEAHYKKIKILIDKISTQKGIKDFLSFIYIENKLSDWLVARKLNNFEEDFISFLELNASKDVKFNEVWIPIPFTSAVKNFSFGQIDFKIITENIIRDWFEPIDEDIKKKVQNKEEKEQFIEKLRKDFQGFIAGVISIKAEKIKAKEIGFQKVSDVISFLRVFSPAIFHPQLIVGAYEYGWNNYESEKSLVFTGEEKGKSFQMSEAVRDNGLHWTIDDHVLNFIIAPENQNFNLLLKLENRNSFQKDIYNSILIFSRHALKRDLSDKIMYILVALESILLKNETEPIQQNLSDRIAYMITKTPDDRQAVVKKLRIFIILDQNLFIMGNRQLNQWIKLRNSLRLVGT